MHGKKNTVNKINEINISKINIPINVWKKTQIKQTK